MNRKTYIKGLGQTEQKGSQIFYFHKIVAHSTEDSLTLHISLIFPDNYYLVFVK